MAHRKIYCERAPKWSSHVLIRSELDAFVCFSFELFHTYSNLDDVDQEPKASSRYLIDLLLFFAH